MYKDNCSCPFCQTELKNGCLSPEFCKPCCVTKNSSIEVCDVCESEYSNEYKQCPICQAEQNCKS
jgi:hypothetical protein